MQQQKQHQVERQWALTPSSRPNLSIGTRPLILPTISLVVGVLEQGVSRDGDKWMKMRVGAYDGVQGGHKMYTGSGWMSLRPVLTAACVALHRSACSRGIQAGRERDSSQVSVCGCVLSTLPLHGVVLPCRHLLSRVPPSPFIVCKGRGQVTTFGCMKMERKCPKVLPIPSFSLSSCIRTVIIAVVARRGCRW
jgi:hypothetical protein